MSLRLEPVYPYEKSGKHIEGQLASDDSLGLLSGWHVKTWASNDSEAYWPSDWHWVERKSRKIYHSTQINNGKLAVEPQEDKALDKDRRAFINAAIDFFENRLLD
jgi:hypothetical protein